MSENQEKLKQLEGVVEKAGKVCHELNQPLQILLAYAEMIMADLGADHPVYARFASMLEQIDRMKAINKHLMSVIQLETTPYLDATMIDTNKTSPSLSKSITEEKITHH